MPVIWVVIVGANLDLRALKYFEAVYETNSVSAAAKRCFISQPSISMAISQLEQTLDCKLFIRHARGTLPTPEAEKLYPLSREITGSATALLNVFKDKPVSVPLRMGLKRSLGAERMSRLLKELANRIANLELTLVDPDEPCDCRIIDADQVQINEQFVPIWTDTYMLAIPSNMPLSLSEEIALSDFEGLPFIHRNTCPVLSKLQNQLKNGGFRYQMRANIRTIEYTQALVSAGVGAALLPDWQEVTSRKDLILRPIKDTRLEQVIGLAYKDNKGDQELVQTCIQVCHDVSNF